MPGIFGILSFNDNPGLLSVIHSMHTSLTHRNTFISDAVFKDNQVYAGRCHIGVVNTAPQPANVDDIFVWLDGEFYNQGDFPIKGGDSENDALLLAKNYLADPTLGFLKIVDGFFSAVIYDRSRKKLLLCTDRYGLEHLYWTKAKDHIAWASEYKAFLDLPGFNTVIDREAMQSFIDVGYIRGNRTWMSEVSLVPPATIIAFDIKSGAMTSSRYWSWGDIQATDTKFDFREIAEEWGRRFKRAVDVRSRPYEKTGIALSGGLDSRAILAAMPGKGQTINSFTFGENGCDDMRIAARVARLKGTRHALYEIDTPLWLQANVAAVWCTDGEICLLDGNGYEFAEAVSKQMSIDLNGMGGDSIQGSTLLEIRNKGGSSLQELFENQDRRLIRPGFRFVESFCRVRMPFYDNSLVEFILSFPEKLRADSYLYNQLLLFNYPDYFRTIPWQYTGVPISYPSFVANAYSLGRRAKSKIARLANRYGIALRDPMITVSQRRRTITEPGRTFFSNLFSDKCSLYPEYINKERVAATWERHLAGKDATQLINRYATIEIWLRQVFFKTLRPNRENFPFVDTPYNFSGSGLPKS
jgi:asparagine synthase (glutamine-hydrolysing)